MTTSSPELTTPKVGLAAPVENKLHATKEAVETKAGKVKQRLQKGSEAVQDKAEEATLQARSATNVAWAKLPSPVSGRGRATRRGCAATAGAGCRGHAESESSRAVDAAAFPSQEQVTTMARRSGSRCAC